MKTFDWNFAVLENASETELINCCIYEYARESASIVAHYHDGKPIKSGPQSFDYVTRVNGVLQILPNPFLWPALSGTKLFCHAWQELNQNYRDNVCDNYKSLAAGEYRPSAFMSACSADMKPQIISQGNKRNGIDCQTGYERLAVEIDWAFYTNAEIVESFKKWIVDKRPVKIGFKTKTGRMKENSWIRKLDNLAIMRLLHDSPLLEMENKFPDAWKRFMSKSVDKETQESQIREMYKKREDAVRDFHELFPFLPVAEQPCSWLTKSSGNKEGQIPS